MVCGQVKIGPFGTVSGYEDSWLKLHKIRAFHTICSGKINVQFTTYLLTLAVASESYTRNDGFETEIYSFKIRILCYM